MTIGERIKKIRVFRKMTMDELGGALGFEGKNMSVRISQYETGARIPGEDMILKLADALHCNYKAISDYSLGAAEDIIETLFWLEESATSLPARGKGTRFPEYTAPGNLIHLTAMTPAKSSETARPTYNEDDYDSEEIENHLSNPEFEESQAFSGDRDQYFADAGRFIIEKERASIGMLQRVFKIGFNRAARIMDQLGEAGVVGPEEGTKPRKVMMTMEEFEEFLKNN